MYSSLPASMEERWYLAKLPNSFREGICCTRRRLYGLARNPAPPRAVVIRIFLMPAPLDSISAKRIEILRGLAHPSRLLIAEALMDGELCVCEIRDLVGDDVSTVSKHLAILRKAGVVRSEKRGLNVYYSLGCECFAEFLRCVDSVCIRPSSSRPNRKKCC